MVISNNDSETTPLHQAESGSELRVEQRQGEPPQSERKWLIEIFDFQKKTTAVTYKNDA